MKKEKEFLNLNGFIGFYQNKSLLCNAEYHYNNLSKMLRTQEHRKQNTSTGNLILTDSFALGSTCRIQTIQMYEKTYHLLLCGELYNQDELTNNLKMMCFRNDAQNDAQLILLSYLCFGSESFISFKGNFSFALICEEENSIYLVRDALGCKPLYYSQTDNIFLFATEPKALLAHPDVTPEVGKSGFCEVFFLGPASTPGITPYKNIFEVKPGHYLFMNATSLHQQPYWCLKTHAHTDSYKDTVDKTASLIRNAILQQSKPHNRIACLLSGGIDSSIVTAICANTLKEENISLKTYSFDYEENDTYFHANSFQPSMDRPFVDKMVSAFDTDHTYLSCSQKELFDTLKDSLLSHDIPPMADVDASLLFFCRKIAPHHPIVLTGECADEVFGGYPWFHREELLDADTFPWSLNLITRTGFLKKELLEELNAKDYVQNAYKDAIHRISYLPRESICEQRKRRNAYLSLTWFGATLLKRMERCAASGGVIPRLPFADRDLVEYIYNVPWDMKLKDGVIKSLLRTAFDKDLPEEILWRKKSPYPKTYHPAYEELLRQTLSARLEDSSSPLHLFIDKEKLLTYIHEPKDYTAPWYGQLMAGPQMLAYLLQIDFWLKNYHIDLNL